MLNCFFSFASYPVTFTCSALILIVTVSFFYILIYINILPENDMSSIPYLNHYLLCSLTYWLTGTFIIIVNRSGNSKHFCLIPRLRGNILNMWPLSVVFSMHFFYTPFQIREVFSIPDCIFLYIWNSYYSFSLSSR
jgi:hypothetical protein